MTEKQKQDFYNHYTQPKYEHIFHDFDKVKAWQVRMWRGFKNLNITGPETSEMILKVKEYWNEHLMEEF